MSGGTTKGIQFLSFSQLITSHLYYIGVSEKETISVESSCLYPWNLREGAQILNMGLYGDYLVDIFLGCPRKFATCHTMDIG